MSFFDKFAKDTQSIELPTKGETENPLNPKVIECPNMEIRYTSMIPKNKLVRQHPFDAGVDLRSVITRIIPAGERELIKTGLTIEIPEGFVGLIWSRSGLSVKYGIEVGAGCVDAGYRGEIGVVLHNHGNLPYMVNIGDRIAQLLIVPISLPEFVMVENLTDTERGEGGFGSTGKS